MKKTIYIIILALLFFISGCQKENDTPPVPVVEDHRPDAVKHLPYDPQALVVYLEENLEDMDAELKTLSLFTLEDTLSTNLALVGNILWEKDMQDALRSLPKKDILFQEDLEPIQTKDIKKELKKITSSYYAFQRVGERYIPIIDYRKFLELTDTMDPVQKEYFTFKMKETERPLLLYGEIYLEPTEFMDRLKTMETFIKEHPDFLRTKEMLDRFQYSLYLFLSGTTLSPVVDEEGNVREDYLLLRDQITEPTTISERTFLKGLGLLEKHNNKYDDETLEKMRNLVFDSIFELKQQSDLR